MVKGTLVGCVALGTKVVVKKGGGGNIVVCWPAGRGRGRAEWIVVGEGMDEKEDEIIGGGESFSIFVTGLFMVIGFFTKSLVGLDFFVCLGADVIVVEDLLGFDGREGVVVC